MSCFFDMLTCLKAFQSLHLRRSLLMQIGGAFFSKAPFFLLSRLRNREGVNHQTESDLVHGVTNVVDDVH